MTDDTEQRATHTYTHTDAHIHRQSSAQPVRHAESRGEALRKQTLQEGEKGSFSAGVAGRREGGLLAG